MEDKIGTNPVYIGENKIVVNHGTMSRIVLDWLHQHHSGGPYRVTNVKQVKDGGMYSNHDFEITFTDEPDPIKAA